MREHIEQSDGEFIVVSEDTADFQKKIRQWLASGYAITILHQTATMYSGGGCKITASIVRYKL